MNLARPCIVLFWLVMAGWLVRYEAFPHWFARAAPGYRALMGDGPVIRDDWMRIESAQGAPIGYSHTWIESDVESAAGGAVLHNQTALTLTMLGRTQNVTTSVRAALDAAQRLQRFQVAVLAGVYETRIEGRRAAGSEFDVRIRAGRGEQALSVTIPDEAILYSPAADLALAGLRPGQSLTLRVLDPMTLSLSDLRVEALRRDTLRHGGRDEPALAVGVFYQGLETRAWLDGEGRVLRQETPFGWTLVRSVPGDALAGAPPGAPAEDLALALAVPVFGPAGDLRGAPALDLRLHGGRLATQELVTARQALWPERESGRGLRLVVRAQAAPARRAPRGSVPAALRADLASTAAVPADHPAIVDRARRLAGEEPDAWRAALALHDWVFRTLRKEPTASLASALDVLERGAGDCTEHTVLYVALARAAGLPARMHVGLVYAELDGRPGAFYYHAWPAVYVGEWVELDPTLGQTGVDATHVTLARGEWDGPLKLLGAIGQLRIEVLALRAPEPGSASGGAPPDRSGGLP